MDVSPNLKKKKMMLRLFPYLKDKSKASELMIDDESIYYISVREYADKTTKIILNHLKELNMCSQTSIIIDGTAGVGGNTISFSNYFKYVYAIEYDQTRSELLKNNIGIYNCYNVKIINDDCMNWLNIIEDHNVIFLDPPWGGSDYKQHKTLRLSINDESIESICNKLMDSTYMKKLPDLVVLKLPTNYDLKYFYDTLNKKNIYYYNLKKMIILVLMIQTANIE